MCRALTVKAIEVMQVKYKPYATIERADFQMPWILTIWNKMKIALCEHHYGARKLC